VTRRISGRPPRVRPAGSGRRRGRSLAARGKILAQGPRDKDAVVAADLNLDMIDEVRAVWQFFRDRRPDAYGPLVAP